MYSLKRNPVVALFFLATLFMVVFQLVTRLVAYTFMFHQGVLLLSAALLGAGLGMMLLNTIPERWRTRCEAQLPFVMLIAWLVYIVAFFATQNLIIHFVILMVLFGTFFVLITQLIYFKPNHFTALELAGSFLGAIGLVVLSHTVLEEWLLVGVTALIVVYVYLTIERARLRGWLGVGLLLILGVFTYQLSTHSLPQLVTCPGPRATYKIACVETNETFQLLESIPNVKGRSDVFLRTTTDVPRLSVYSSGLHSGTSLPRDVYVEMPPLFFDVEIPPLAYASKSTVVTAGASTGSNVVTFQKYIENPTVTAVEIDTIITDLYESERYAEFLPERDSFTFVYQDARSFFDSSDQTYDVVSMMVESVNTTMVPYVDESTSLVYTTEAMRTYVDALNSDGYLLLQQFHAPGAAGAAMINKVLVSLETALSPEVATDFEDNILLYSTAAGAGPGAQHFLAAVYKPDGFTDADLRTFTAWEESLTHQLETGQIPYASFELLHMPDGSLTYDPYFKPSEREALAAAYNTSVITDDKPFRHMVTTLPFPLLYYAILAVALSLMLVLIPHQRKGRVSIHLALSAFILGVATFGLQYVLYYKTATFLGTSLIFFSVFLLVPLLFGAIGGYLSQLLRPRYVLGLLLLSLVAGYLLVSGTAFALPPAAVFGLVAILFVFSGMLFPLLLAQEQKEVDRTLLYALNMCGGGTATLLAITLHAVIGWTYLFVGVLALLLVFFVFLYRQFVVRA